MIGKTNRRRGKAVGSEATEVLLKMKRLLAVLAALALLLGCAAVYAESAAAETVWTTTFTAHCATVEEGQQLMRGRTLFHDQIREKCLAFLLQRKDGTLEDYIEYSASQVMEFTPEEEQRVNDVMAWLHDTLEAHGLQLPDPGTVTFVKSTGQEALGSAGYTSGGAVFLAWFTYAPEYYTDQMFRELVVHELSHCLSRLYPEYRQALYSLINFTVVDQDFDVPEEIMEQIVANPDVEHHNSYATFTINGEKKDCYLVFMTEDTFENPGDTFFSGMYSGVVPLDGSAVYKVGAIGELCEVDDFWEVVGENTYYVEDPEEVMATNFAYALTWLDDGYDSFASPEILEGIVDYLKVKADTVTSATLKIDRLPAVKPENNSILVVYFSPDDTVRAAAYTIAAELNAGLFEIVPEERYTAEDLNYMNSKSRSMTEMADSGARPAIAALPEDLDAYNTVFLCYPIWGGQAPKIILSFLESVSLSGKTVIPFATSNSSGFGNSDAALKKLTDESVTWIKGKGVKKNAGAEEIISWIKELALQ